MRTIHLVPWRHDPASLLAGRRALTPNRRAAQALGVPAESLETLARRRLRESGRAIATPLQAHRAMATAVASLGWMDPGGSARAMTPVIRMFLRAGADLDQLAAVGSPRVKRLSALGTAYLEALQAVGVLDGAQALRASATLGAEPEPLAVVGYPRLGQDERAFLNAVAPDGSVVVLPYGHHADYADNAAAAAYFEDEGWRVETDPGLAFEATGALETLRATSSRPVAYAYPNMDEEVRGALAAIKGLLASGVSPEAIALVARQDAAYGPTVLALAWELGVPVRALYAVPLIESRVGSWLQLLLEAVTRELPFEPTFRLLEHPLSPWFPAEKRAEARRRHPQGEAEWRALDLDPTMLLWPAADERGAWVARLKQLMAELQVRRQAARWPREALALKSLGEALGELALPEEEPLTRETFADELRELLGLLTAPAQPGRGGVELHTPLSIFGARYAFVFVLGMAENVLPAVVANSPVLDFVERAELAAQGFPLEDAAGAARRERLSFASLLATATGSLTCSYPRLANNRPALPSAYFRALGLEPEAAPERPLASLEEARPVWLSRGELAPEAALGAMHRAVTVERRREGADPADAHDGIVGVPLPMAGRAFSVTELIALAQCPFKWLTRHAMGLSAVEEQDTTLGYAARGNLYHKALEIAVKGSLGAPDLRQAVLDRLPEALAQAERAEGIPRLPGWDGQRLEHLAALRRAVLADEFLDPGARVVSLEARFEGPWHGFTVKGRVDRIDERPDGTLVLIDYKTSSDAPAGAKDLAGKANLDLQLPLYARVAAPALHPGAAVGDTRYYSLTKGKVLKASRPAPQAIDAIAQRLEAHLQTGCYPVQPDKDRKACHTCDMDIVCRPGARLARKES